MGLIQRIGGQYKNDFLRGRFYSCPYVFPTDSLILVRPLHDGEVDEVLPADIKPLSQCNDAFMHTPYPHLKLKEDEEYILQKTKKRRVLATTNLGNKGLLLVAPVYTLKVYHSGTMDLEKLKENRIPGIIYLEDGENNKESFIPLMEMCSVYRSLLEPIALELTKEGIELLDDNIVMLHDLYSISK